MKPKPLISTLALLPFSGAALADPIEEKRLFVIQPSSITDVAIATLSTGGIVGDMTLKTYTGDFQADFTFDRDTLEVESFQFTGEGEMVAEPYTLNFEDFINYPPSRFTTVQRVPQPTPATSIRFIPETRNNQDGLVNPDGTLDNSDYRINAYSGGYSITWAIQGNPQNPTLVNYSFSPAIQLYKGVSTPTIEEVSSTVYERTIQAYLAIELDESELVTLSGTIGFPDLDTYEIETGTITGKTGQFKINTDYGDWSDENSPIVNLDPEDTNDAGIPYGILYALNLPADASSLPISIFNTPEGPRAKIILPESGLRNPMNVQYSADLSDVDWPDLPDEYWIDGTDSLDLGATGEPTFGFPLGPGGHVRFETVIE